jgi:hypothetical protein
MLYFLFSSPLPSPAGEGAFFLTTALPFTLPFDRPAHFSCTIGIWDDIASKRIAGDPLNKLKTLIFRPDFIGLFLKGRGFNNGSHSAIIRVSRINND